MDTVVMKKLAKLAQDVATLSSASYVHTQSVSSSTWTINHNLGFRPSIELTTSGGSVFFAEIVHTSLNQSIVYLNTTQAGFARCN